jgi:hypothetical protein
MIDAPVLDWALRLPDRALPSPAGTLKNDVDSRTDGVVVRQLAEHDRWARHDAGEHRHHCFEPDPREAFFEHAS